MSTIKSNNVAAFSHTANKKRNTKTVANFPLALKIITVN